MNEVENAASKWAYEHDGAKSRMWLRPSHITAFIAGAAWQREQDAKLVRELLNGLRGFRYVLNRADALVAFDKDIAAAESFLSKQDSEVRDA